jgi:hypothetical protein
MVVEDPMITYGGGSPGRLVPILALSTSSFRYDAISARQGLFVGTMDDGNDQSVFQSYREREQLDFVIF